MSSVAITGRHSQASITKASKKDLIRRYLPIDEVTEAMINI
jgi:hypothetical protein